MNFELLEDRLAALTVSGSKVFSSVMTAVDPETVIRNGIVTRDTAFVVPMGEIDTAGQVNTYVASQDIQETVGVMIAIRSINDRYGKDVNARLNTIKKAVRNIITGWEIEQGYSSFVFTQGEVVEFLKGGVFWMEQYTTTYRFRKE